MATMLRERYSSAVHARSLAVDEKTTYSDSDVLGAYGLADKHLKAGTDGNERDPGRTFTPAPLAVPLERLFAGDNQAAHEIVRILSDMAFMEARRRNVKLAQPQALDMAKMMLAWFRNGACKPCGGRGKPAIKDSPVLSAHDCDQCKGTGKIAFEQEFRYEWKPIAVWLKDCMEAESGRAGPAAMRTIAVKMVL